MKVTLDVRHDTAYIAFKNIEPGEAAFQHTVQDDRLAGGIDVVLDIARDGRLLGVEVIGASAGLPLEALKDAERWP